MKDMNRNVLLYPMLLLFVFIDFSRGQDKADPADGSITQLAGHLPEVDPYFVETKTITSSFGPRNITRNILQDRKGDIWLATWEGIIRYETRLNPKISRATSNDSARWSNSPSTPQANFTNFTNKEGLRRFRVFSMLEDKTGNLWFGTIGAGVYRYNARLNDTAGHAALFTNLTTKDGLVNDRVGCIYEDREGNIWFGTEGGVSCYDGESFRNYTTEDGLTNNDINSIVEDKTGKLWFGTRGDACIYGASPKEEVGREKIFTNIKNQEGSSFENVRSIIADRKGNIWLGGNDGLWCFDGSSFTNLTSDFVGYIYEDKEGNIWTNSAIDGNAGHWVLSCYEAWQIDAAVQQNSLLYQKATGTQIRTEENMFFGILEDTDGHIWFGTLNGVCRYDPTIDKTDANNFDYFRPTVPNNKSSQTHSTARNPNEEQYSNMVGKWVSVGLATDELDSLELLESGNYILTASNIKDKGQWSILDVHHISLGVARYRFFFRSENLVLDDENGKQYEFANQHFGKP